MLGCEPSALLGVIRPRPLEKAFAAAVFRIYSTKLVFLGVCEGALETG